MRGKKLLNWKDAKQQAETITATFVKILEYSRTILCVDLFEILFMNSIHAFLRYKDTTSHVPKYTNIWKNVNFFSFSS